MRENLETTCMTAADVIDLYIELEHLGITIRVDGGWGVDALMGEQPASIRTWISRFRRSMFRRSAGCSKLGATRKSS
jgi:hypothetical protein